MPATNSSPAAPRTRAPSAAARSAAALGIWSRCRKRATRRRLAVLEGLMALDSEKGGATAVGLYEHLQRRSSGVTLTGIYKTLRELEDGDAVERHHHGARPAVFALKHERQRLHLVCTECQAIQYLACAAPIDQLHALAQDNGFAIADATVTLRGLCLRCSPLNPPANDARIA